MKKNRCLLVHALAVVLVNFGNAYSLDFSIDPEPIATICTPQELYTKKNHAIVFAGDRPRSSTCGSIRWFHDDYVATVNFEAGAIQTYFFDRKNKTFTPLQTICGTSEALLRTVEHIDFSPNGDFLAVSINSLACVYIYKIDPLTHLIAKNPFIKLKQADKSTHGVRFDKTGNYLICTSIRGEDRISVYEYCEKNASPTWSPVATLKNAFGLCKPKSIVFTKDNRYMVAIYAKNVVGVPHNPEGVAAVYRFYDDQGTIQECPISIYKGNCFDGGEDLDFNLDDSALIISGHTTDELLVLHFDKETGKIGDSVKKLSIAPHSISFPHGLSISPDGKYLGVANYGNDACSIYRVRYE